MRHRTNVSERGRVLVAGLLSSPSGIGEGGRLVRSGLESLGYDISTYDLSPIIQPDLSVVPVEPADMDDGLGPIILHVNPSEVPKALFCLRHQNLKNRRLIGVWAWELERAPKYWKYCSHWFDEIWAISDFMKSSLSDLPVSVFHVGYPIEKTSPESQIDWRNRLNLGEDFVVLIAFDTRSSLARKNPFAAVEAFKRAFPQTENVKLIVKVSGPFSDEHRAALKSNSIILLEETLSRADMSALIQSVDCHLSLSRAEGLGLVAAEAAANGIAVIITGWSGPEEWRASPNVHLVDYTLINITDEDKIYSNIPNLRWADPNIDDAAVKLRGVYEQAAEVRTALSFQAQSWWDTHYSAHAFKSRIPNFTLDHFQKKVK